MHSNAYFYLLFSLLRPHVSCNINIITTTYYFLLIWLTLIFLNKATCNTKIIKWMVHKQVSSSLNFTLMSTYMHWTILCFVFYRCTSLLIVSMSSEHLMKLVKLPTSFPSCATLIHSKLTDHDIVTQTNRDFSFKGPLTCKCLMTSVDVYEFLHHKIITC